MNRRRPGTFEQRRGPMFGADPYDDHYSGGGAYAYGGGDNGYGADPYGKKIEKK